MVWDYSLDNYLNDGVVEVLYEFDPTYVDQCHPNYPDCVSGQNSCPNCQNTSNPILRVSGKVVTYGHNTDVVVTDVPERPNLDEELFKVTLSPNPVRDRMTITTDYEKGRVGVHVINTQGVIVKDFNFIGTTMVDMSDLPAGIYTVQLLGDKLVTRKVVKQ